MAPLPNSPASDAGRSDRQRLEGYGDGGFRVSGVRHIGSVIVLPEATLTWSLDDPAELTIEHLAPVLDCDPPVDILLFGGGRSLVPVGSTLRSTLQNRGIAIEPMDTGAACRTFAVLAAEGRRVAAALVAVD